VSIEAIVQINGEGQNIVAFPLDFLKKLGWQNGDRLSVTVSPDGSVIVAKPTATAPAIVEDDTTYWLDLTPDIAQFEWYWGRGGDCMEDPLERMRRAILQPHVQSWVDENLRGEWAVHTVDHLRHPRYTGVTIIMGFGDRLDAEMFQSRWLTTSAPIYVQNWWLGQ
jgi:bifunctional DNA-binding transcriptional regulator/antitoxin component of YhaV-PrlF toxin-antitoxin module